MATRTERLLGETERILRDLGVELEFLQDEDLQETPEREALLENGNDALRHALRYLEETSA